MSTRWTLIERVRIWLAGVVLGRAIWRRMCDAGWCPHGQHIRREEWIDHSREAS